MTTKINTARVLLGVLVAGVVANICDTVTNLMLLTQDTQQMLQRLGRDVNVMNETSIAVTWAVIDFVYAAVIVFTYAAIRPRFGAGPKTAVLAGVLIWLPVTVVLFGFLSMGIFTPAVYWKNAGLTFISTVLASLAGGAVYKE